MGPADDVVYESEQPQTTLTGGSIDDNERFEDYLAYRDDFFGLGIRVRDLDPGGRIVVTVTGEGGLPAAGAEVVVAGEGVEVSLRTTADGTVRFHPEAYAAGAGPFTVSAGGATTEAPRGQSVVLETSLPTAAGETVALDVLFLLDATGSMDDEIYQLKITIDEVAQRIHRLPGDVDVRLGMTLYRDEFDSFLTSTFDLTPDIDAFAEALSEVVAYGGGDYPEALDEALADALSQPSWRSPANTVQLVFLVADAPPQVLRQVPVPYTESMREAARQGIKIFPVSSSGTDDQAEFVFRQLAQFTGARYVFLTYGAGGRATGSSERHRRTRLRGTFPGRPHSPASRRRTRRPGRPHTRGTRPRTTRNTRRRPTRQLNFPFVGINPDASRTRNPRQRIPRGGKASGAALSDIGPGQVNREQGAGFIDQ